VEASALTHTTHLPGLRGPSPLLRLQSDEKLIALTRRGQPAAFETLCSRYQSRLLAFCRHMLGSREDAEDVLQEVFAAAFNAVRADDREINVRPWLYRIARNRSLNHLRRASAVGVDSMDVHFAEHGLSTGDRAIRRESFRELLADVKQLPETQRTALLLREMDALSYDQIAHAMETTVPSVKSLLVRARISLAEAAEARKLSCSEVRLELGEVAEGLTKLSAPARRHVRDCDRCSSFKKQLKQNNHALAAMLPVGPLLMAKKLLLAKLGSTASAGGAHVAGGAGATVGAGATAGAGATGGTSVAGGLLTAGAGAIATKAVAGLAAAAIVTAGAVAVDHASFHHVAARASYAPAHRYTPEPLVVGAHSQPITPAPRPVADRSDHHSLTSSAKAIAPVPAAPSPAGLANGVPPGTASPPKTTGTPGTQVTAATTELPTVTTDDAPETAAVSSQPPSSVVPSATSPAGSTPIGEAAPSSPPAPEQAATPATEPPPATTPATSASQSPDEPGQGSNPPAAGNPPAAQSTTPPSESPGAPSAGG
jgi:RNA polymerase sigma factor (sigma-70 family)